MGSTQGTIGVTDVPVRNLQSEHSPLLTFESVKQDTVSIGWKKLIMPNVMQLLDLRLAIFSLIIALVLSLLRRLQTNRREHSPLPPGPVPLPIVGNVLSLDASAPWITYEKWGKTYGDLLYTRLFNKDVITINSEKVARDLLEQRSHNYSDRPVLGTIDLFGQSFNSSLFRYGEKWRQHRRIFHQAFRADAAIHFRPLQLRKAHQLLVNLLDTPEEYANHLRTLSASIIMAVVYGYDAASRQDPLVALVETLLDMVVEVLTPEMAAVLDAFPFLKSLPYWFPGAGFQRKALKCRTLTTGAIETPFQHAMKNMKSAFAMPCMISDVLSRRRDNEKSREYEQILKEAAVTAFGAASETTTATLQVFLLAMVLHPEAQERAQAEIDTVVGKDRLPGFDDRPSLPYIEAILRETLRWYPTVPLCIPHAAVNYDIYDGYYIPKGATVVPNVWAMSRNEAKYPNASEFRPERFLADDGKLSDDTVNFAFGFGRRACVGRYVADASLWAAIASMLAVFRFRKARDQYGEEIDFVPQWASGITTHPLPFPCCIEPRSSDMNSENLAHMIDLKES